MRTVEEQYWYKGLHDAQITNICSGSMTTNYKKKPSLYNYLRLSIDADGAIYDTNVTEIAFYNYSAKWKGGRIKDFSYYLGNWWLGDSLEKEKDKYSLTIHLQSIDKNKVSEQTIIIEFEHIEVKRKG